MDTLTAQALSLGEGFQMNGCPFGAFGDQHVAGMSRLEDLREGEHMALLALALR
ncbi:hypothetical protein [Streptomyces sp. NPDC056479]|uniref:hypothetical protein n=1 Tax=unclassified Streptomyces TaxID=2593676 RepID=UPI003673DC9A